MNSQAAMKLFTRSSMQVDVVLRLSESSTEIAKRLKCLLRPGAGECGRSSAGF